MPHDLLPFFAPRGVAIIGASASANKLSYGILRNMTLYGYQGQVAPVVKELAQRDPVRARGRGRMGQGQGNGGSAHRDGAGGQAASPPVGHERMSGRNHRR